MFAPTKTWRRWHRKVNVTQKRHAVASALAAAALPALVMARGHKIDAVPELPLVLSSGVEKVQKTAVAAAVLKAVGLDADLAHAKESRKVRCGAGKQRNRRYVQRRGPLVIFANDEGISKAFRNIPGVDLCSVNRLNLLQLAPGGTFGRLCVFSQGAMVELQKIFGTYNGGSAKKGYTLPRAAMTNADVARIINSDAIQSVVAPAKEGGVQRAIKKNALTNKAVRGRVSPGANSRAKARALEATKGTKANATLQAKKAKSAKTQTARSKQARNWFKATMAKFDAKPTDE